MKLSAQSRCFWCVMGHLIARWIVYYSNSQRSYMITCHVQKLWLSKTLPYVSINSWPECQKLIRKCSRLAVKPYLDMFQAFPANITLMIHDLEFGLTFCIHFWNTAGEGSKITWVCSQQAQSPSDFWAHGSSAWRGTCNHNQWLSQPYVGQNGQSCGGVQWCH